MNEASYTTILISILAVSCVILGITTISFHVGYEQLSQNYAGQDIFNSSSPIQPSGEWPPAPSPSTPPTEVPNALITALWNN